MEITIRRILLILFFYGINTSCSESTVSNEYHWQNYAELHDEVKQLILNEEYQELTRLGEKIRTEKLRFKNGDWCLKEYYNGIGLAHSTHAAIYRTLEDWEREIPGINFPIIANARAHRARAWEIRGTERYKNLSPEIRTEFAREMNIAFELGNKASNIGSDDAELYNTLLSIAHAMGFTEEITSELYELGTTIEPNYYPIYYTHYNFSQPRWGGSNQFLKSLVDNSIERSKDHTTYARLASYATYYSNDIFKDKIFEWSRVKKGFRIMENEWPESISIGYNFCFLAMINDDTETVSRLMKNFEPGWDRTKQKVFRNKTWYESWEKHVANGK